MLRVGLTGNIASGKSAVAETWRGLGAHVIDADALARQAVAPGSEALRRIVRRFGAGVLRADGSLDRAALRAIVFNDADRRDALERILHPEIARLRAAEEEKLALAGAAIVVHEIPLLFETGLDGEFDLVVLVDAPEHVRLRRIVAARGVDEQEAKRMMAAQQPAAPKRARAAIVIDNDGTLEQLRARAAEAWQRIRERAG
jgi:dephospho-CoA kinase